MSDEEESKYIDSNDELQDESDNSEDELGTNANGINSGRWTRDEHNKFLQGLEAHGKEWKRIADLIKTRTVVQIRTHAQKYFQKVAKHTGGPVMSTSKKEVVVRPPTRKRRGEKDDGSPIQSSTAVKPEAIHVPALPEKKIVLEEKKESGGATPRTIAAATILLQPRIQNKLQHGADTPKTRETAEWLAAHQESAVQTLGKRRRSTIDRAHHSPRIGRFTGASLSWDAVAAAAMK